MADSSTITKLAVFGLLGLGGVAVAASLGGMTPNPKQHKAGEKFGPLMLKESRGKTAAGFEQWLVQCEKCGHEAVRDMRALEETKAKGRASRCLRCDKPGPKSTHKPFAGMRLGKVKLVREKSPGEWVVRCDCGKEEVRNARNLQLSASLHSVPQCRDCRIKKIASRRPSGLVEREVLRALEDGPKGAAVIAAETKMGTSTVWNALVRMRGRGWVDYDAHRGATSAAQASLTSAGEKQLHGSA